MLFLRSLIFNIAFYILLFGLVVFGAPVMFFGRHGVFALARTWARATIWLQRVICGVHVEFRGVEHVPKGAFILAAKHQSVWETFALTLFAPDYSFLLKRELTWIPFFGWMLISSEQIETASTRLAEEALARDPALAEAFPLPPQTEPAKA